MVGRPPGHLSGGHPLEALDVPADAPWLAGQSARPGSPGLPGATLGMSLVLTYTLSVDRLTRLASATSVAFVVDTSELMAMGITPPLRTASKKASSSARWRPMGAPISPTGLGSPPRPYSRPPEVVEAGNPSARDCFEGLLGEARMPVGEVGDGPERAVRVTQADLQVALPAGQRRHLDGVRAYPPAQRVHEVAPLADEA